MPTPYCYLRCGDLRSPGVTERRIGPLGLRDDDDDDDDDDVRSRRAQLAPGFTRKQ